ncbi:hypothetical protein [Sporosarcina sp. FSL K6-3457]|uniref:hypothetical protein n=1 Tax=Sporosarcina sp. FSL K6-3457 TaxID=2978204 RepID=UPI0030FAA648
MKLFSFEHDEGTEVVIARNAKDAVIHYFTKYQDDIVTDDLMSATEDGIKISEIQGDALLVKRSIFDEELNNQIEISYQDMIDEYKGTVPDVIICPNY